MSQVHTHPNGRPATRQATTKKPIWLGIAWILLTQLTAFANAEPTTPPAIPPSQMDLTLEGAPTTQLQPIEHPPPEEPTMPDTADAADTTVAKAKSWPELKTQLDALGDDQAQKEALLTTWLTRHPESPYTEEARFYLARVFAWQQKFNASLAVYDQLLAMSPQNSDYALGKAQVYLWMKEPDRALPLLDQAIQASPNYEDAYRLKIQALLQQNQKKEAEQTRAEAIKRFPQSDWSVSQPVGDLPIELDAGYGYQHLTNHYSYWANQYLSFKKPFSRNAGLYGQVERTDRFDKADLGLSGGAYFPIPNSKWSVTTEGGISPTNNVLARWSAMGAIHRKLPLGFIASAGYRHTEYRDAVTELGTYTLENYWRKFYVSYTLFQSYLHHGGQVFSHMGQLRYFYGERSHVGLTGTLGQELINLGPTRGVQAADVQSIALSGLQMVKPRWGVTYLLILEKQGDLYTRRGFQLGLRYLI